MEYWEIKKHWKYDIVKCGFNYRLSDINCALGLSQLKNRFFLKRKKNLQEIFNRIKNYNVNLIIPKYSESIKPSYHLFIINIFFDHLKLNKDSFMKYMLDHKIMVQQHYIPIYKFTIHKFRKNNFKGSEKYFKIILVYPYL